MEDKITIQNLDLYYSEFHALKDINMHIREKKSLHSSGLPAAANLPCCAA